MFVKEMSHIFGHVDAGLTQLTTFFRVLEIGVIAISERLRR